MADLELNSIGNGDGNNYLLRDNSKIPLAGSNQISGSLIPATTDAYDLGGSSYQWNNTYVKSLTINGTACGDILTHNVSEFVPRSGGAVMTSPILGRTVDDNELCLCGGTDNLNAASLSLFGKDAYPVYGLNGALRMYIRNANLGQRKSMYLYPSGTWTWDGTACQITSDQRYKQQIAEIDDKLLDAWEDVEPCQFKYNEAVKEKSDSARLHTGYVVQQIDEACKSHNVDISKYGLYCHEVYAEETREVENEDGTKTTEVVRPANEHYSLRYTETLIVECAYLRRENNRLKERLSKIEKLLNI